ncbi:type II CAAX prenyl endopeptidase Rce1 family protein [Pontibacter silvestris]|uniref:Type II CAAX prenyl endopeptidase Rce1 family protein n=1 Tax=Pontibacter silvestris TaxID=2305183 RepID=A0ABW4WXS5_9BACT|nr:CPBP family glutamic-type intramembrane protease [Pontibacter silvestris]MCC9138791.1 CPBP family glutamic-type intramembrane protease [Pontibacter silvestris]
MLNKPLLLLNPKQIRIESPRIGEVINFVIIIIYVYLVADPISKMLGASVQTESIHSFSNIELLIAIILAPIYEEIIFRTHLSGERKHFWSILIIIVILVVVFNNLGLFFIIPVATFFIVIIFNYQKFFNFAIEKHFNITFYVTSVLFAVVHYQNIDVDSPIKKIVILLLTYVPISIYFGYIRKKYGLLSSITVHSINNLLILYINSLVY